MLSRYIGRQDGHVILEKMLLLAGRLTAGE